MNTVSKWTIRVFRASDDAEACDRFVHAHQASLEFHGVGKVDAADGAWIRNPAVVVVVAEREGAIVAGLRVHEPGWGESLPFERALARVAPSLWKRLAPEMPGESGEVCALFRSPSPGEVSKAALADLMEELAIAGLRTARSSGITTLWGIAPRHTEKFWYRMGYRPETRFGDAAKFDYPDARYPCHIVSHDLVSLKDVPEELRKRILVESEMRVAEGGETRLCPAVGAIPL